MRWDGLQPSVLDNVPLLFPMQALKALVLCLGFPALHIRVRRTGKSESRELREEREELTGYS
uniref:Uncharacterized protein n=1 Tax=Esox lucius TaxID=8010 RepID=A0AAY5K6J6_ESOLU